ncbi:MAG: type secretion system protein [Proteobacteria bacterium]|nr:type secretion system protein [Pseudomonadota bacterium]
MKKSVRWGLTLALIFILCFIVRLPAGLLAHALPPSVSLAGVEGSIWNGSASALGIEGIVTQEKLHWQFEPLGLLHASLIWQLSGEHNGQPGTVRVLVGPRQQALEQVKLSLPLEPLTRFNQTLAGVRLGGTVQLESTHLALHEPLKLTLRLERVSSSMATEAALLGSYQVSIDADAAGAGKLQVSSLGGALQVNGEGSFALANKAVDLSLHLKPAEDLPGLAPLLATLPRDQGQYLLNFKRP